MAQTWGGLIGQPHEQQMVVLGSDIAKKISHKSIFKVAIHRHRKMASKPLPSRQDESESEAFWNV